MVAPIKDVFARAIEINDKRVEAELKRQQQEKERLDFINQQKKCLWDMNPDHPLVIAQAVLAREQILPPEEIGVELGQYPGGGRFLLLRFGPISVNEYGDYDSSKCLVYAISFGRNVTTVSPHFKPGERTHNQSIESAVAYVADLLLSKGISPERLRELSMLAQQEVSPAPAAQ